MNSQRTGASHPAWKQGDLVRASAPHLYTPRADLFPPAPSATSAVRRHLLPPEMHTEILSTLQNGRRQSRAPSSPRRSTASRRSHGRTAAAKHVRSSPPPSSRLTMCHLPEEATTLAMVHRAARWARLAERGPGVDAVSQPGARDGAVLCISSCKRLSRSIDVCTSQRGLGYLRGWRRNWLDSSGSATQRSDQI